VKGSVRSVSTKPKRERKSELEKQVAKLELEAERKAASGGGAGAEATTDASVIATEVTKPSSAPPTTDADIREAVIRTQWEHPEYGLKRVAKHLRQELNMICSDNRCKKFLIFPPHEHGAVCVVGEVFENSPAAKAGLAQGDIIVKLDGQTGKDYVGITETLVPLIQEGKLLSATVLRRPGVRPIGKTTAKDPKGGEILLELTPAKWDGGGLLGCRLHEHPFRVKL